MIVTPLFRIRKFVSGGDRNRVIATRASGGNRAVSNSTCFAQVLVSAEFGLAQGGTMCCNMKWITIYKTQGTETTIMRVTFIRLLERRARRQRHTAHSKLASVSHLSRGLGKTANL